MSFAFIKSNISMFYIIWLLVVMVMLPNGDLAIGPFATPNSSSASHEYMNADAIMVWNNITSQLGLKEKLSPVEFSRMYALVNIAMYDSLLATKSNNHNYYDMALAEAASNVLIYLFPSDTDAITKLKNIQTDQLQKGNLFGEKELMFGNHVAQAVINYSKQDNSNLIWDGKIPKMGNCIWNGTKPLVPMAGFWKTYILKSGSEIQPAKPHKCNSKVDLLDLTQTYEAWTKRTPKQIAAVHYWGDKPPPVIWNTILAEKIQKYNMSIFDAAYSSVYLNVGMYDAFVSCWYTKYTYWSARPIQRIPNISTEIPTPNFPGYTSGHSVISMVAGRVMSEIFPTESDYFNNEAKEAGFSRLWAGIHFKQDILAGMKQGSKIAEKLVEDMHGIPHPFIYNS